jgi:hypothetical protein
VLPRAKRKTTRRIVSTIRALGDQVEGEAAQHDEPGADAVQGE